MMIVLTDEQTAWLAAQVADGRFGSVDEAARAIIDEQMAVESENLDWAKPLLDAASDAIERGDYVPLEDVQKRLAARIARLSVE